MSALRWIIDRMPAWALGLTLVGAVSGVVFVVYRITSSSYTMRAQWATGSLELHPTTMPDRELTCSQANR